MNTKQNNLLREAADPSTSLSRLRELSRLKGKNVRQHLRTLIAANPSIDEKLLWDLAHDCDEQVYANPLFKRLLLANVSWWEQCGTTALMRLLARMGAEAPERARNHLLEQVADELVHLNPSYRGEMKWIWEEEIKIAWNAASGDSKNGELRRPNECIQVFQINAGVGPFPSFYTLIPGERPETAPYLISLLDALVSCLEDFTTSLEIYEGWQFEQEGSDSSPSLKIVSVTPNLPGWEFRIDNDHMLEIVDPMGDVHHIQLSPDNAEEFHQINSIKERIIDRIFPGFGDGRALAEVIRRAFCLDDEESLRQCEGST